jgi:hypothetical protein
MSSSRTRKKRNRWDSDDEGDVEPKAHDSSQFVSTSTLSTSNRESHLLGPAVRKHMLQSSQKLEVVTSTAMGQQQTSVGCDYLCYHYSPLLQGCRNILDCYERLDVIAQGTYGIVWKARDKDSQEIVALKQIKDVGGNEGFPILALREMQALLDLSHDCIVSIREVVVGTSSNEDLDKVFMVFPVRT